MGGLLGGSGLTVAGAAAALTVPMAALTALRVLDHAADRTQPAEQAAAVPGGGGESAAPAGIAADAVAGTDAEPAGPPLDGARPAGPARVTPDRLPRPRPMPDRPSRPRPMPDRLPRLRRPPR
jgi:hypothetical protein